MHPTKFVLAFVPGNATVFSLPPRYKYPRVKDVNAPAELPCSPYTSSTVTASCNKQNKYII